MKKQYLTPDIDLLNLMQEDVVLASTPSEDDWIIDAPGLTGTNDVI